MMLANSLEAQEVRRLRDGLLAAVRPVGDEVVADRGRVDLIAELERLKSAACAVQAELAVDLVAPVRSRDARQGVRPERRGRGVAAQVALARQESPHRGGVLLGLAKDLVTDLGCTHAALREGRINEYRAQVIATESGPLGREDRAGVDEAVCGVDADGHSPVDTMGTAQLTGEIRRRVQALDPAAVVRRNAKAEKARRVTIRPTPDTMVYLNGLLPVAQGVAAYAALTTAAASLISQGDERSKAQIMADLMVERLTGQTTADDVAVTIDVVISDEALLGAGHEPAVLPDAPGAPTIPAQVARNLAAHTLSSPTTSWIRSLYADPTGRLVAMSTRQRFTTHGLAELLKLRDQGICRTPWCDAPIRHTDHITPAAVGGQTTESNTQGLCQACNHAKQADGWTQHTIHDIHDTHRAAHRRDHHPHRPPTPIPRPRPTHTRTHPTKRAAAPRTYALLPRLRHRHQ